MEVVLAEIKVQRNVIPTVKADLLFILLSLTIIQSNLLYEKIHF